MLLTCLKTEYNKYSHVVTAGVVQRQNTSGTSCIKFMRTTSANAVELYGT